MQSFKARDQHTLLFPPAAPEWEVLFVQHWVAPETTIPRDMFNILPCISDIFFCMKSDICSVNILQPPLCKKIKKRKERKTFYTQTKKMMPGGRFTRGLLLRGPWSEKRATVTPTGDKKHTGTKIDINTTKYIQVHKNTVCL